MHLNVKLCCVLQDQPLGNWRLKRQVDNEDEVIYKFSPKFVLKAGQSVTVRDMKWKAECALYGVIRQSTRLVYKFNSFK